jgi:hypothetical protein
MTEPMGLHTIGSEGCIPEEHCLIHLVDEPDEPNYRICGECRHVFRTVEELVNEERENYRWSTVTVVDGHEEPPMYACPLCTHDF